MKLEINDAEPEFRARVRAFLDERLPADLKGLPHATEPLDPAVHARWYGILGERGWTMPGWPVEYGGAGWTPEQLMIFNEELNAAGAPASRAFAGIIGPTIYTFGTEAQKAQHLPGLLTGATPWCQGFSEPESGSDLASLRTTAMRDGDHYVVNGSKIWTTFAHRAEWMFCLVRTSKTGAPQTGISFLLIDMNTPGIRVRPITSIDGLHHLNQVFFEDVRVSIDNLVGEENRGWDYAKFLLEVERYRAAPVGPIQARLKQARRLAGTGAQAGRRLIDSPIYRHKLAELEVEALAMEALNLLQFADDDPVLRRGGASMVKLVGGELQQRVSELGMEAVGDYAAVDQIGQLTPEAEGDIVGPAEGPIAMLNYFYGRAATIYGGTAEVQRNILWKIMARN